jgi:CBS domain-containing protein
MANTVRDVMSTNPITLSDNETVVAAAKQMRDGDVGAIVLTENGTVHGIVTDRDLVVRALAEDLDPRSTKLAEICTHDLVTVSPNDSLDTAVANMRQNDVRRIPVVEGDQVVGILSLGDVAIEKDSDSALADISAAEPNN